MRLPPGLLGGADLFNPSLLVRDGTLHVAIRAYLSAVKPHSQIVLGQIGDDWQLANTRVVRGIDVARCGVLGAEDARLFVWSSGRLGAIATTGNSGLDFHLSAFVFDEHLAVADLWHFAPRTKNWVPVLDGSDRVMFSPKGPPITLDITTRRMSDLGSARLSDNWRGGSQLIPHPDGGFISIVHELRRPYGGAAHYWHRFARYDGKLRVTGASRDFVFAGLGIEYAAGMAWWRGRWVISYGVADRTAHLAVVAPATVEQLFLPEKDNAGAGAR